MLYRHVFAVDFERAVELNAFNHGRTHVKLVSHDGFERFTLKILCYNKFKLHFAVLDTVCFYFYYY